MGCGWLKVKGQEGVVDGLWNGRVGIISGGVGRVDGRGSCAVGGFLRFEYLVAVAEKVLA